MIESSILLTFNKLIWILKTYEEYLFFGLIVQRKSHFEKWELKLKCPNERNKRTFCEHLSVRYNKCDLNEVLFVFQLLNKSESFEVKTGGAGVSKCSSLFVLLIYVGLIYQDNCRQVVPTEMLLHSLYFKMAFVFISSLMFFACL